VITTASELVVTVLSSRSATVTVNFRFPAISDGYFRTTQQFPFYFLSCYLLAYDTGA